ncbi:5,10-methylenetetrahydrofolate reductase [Ectothiorhodospira haloalkaliphila]|uniref:Methylenetetrahydrofolate reductase n=1 Tax=Ectothiorhodospira haloalkaliphila TaxID=421628 RepID=W8KXE0_9GAMM|nr:MULTISPECIES: methylenetetrahydrofolate reductase [NAD(P)H] [Ectothiorhodospira]AHK80201.1 5,10-methylenetetrahydrofolate reductase [Ectothiorhodospira haloalkaliphila]MCG5496539.1 methylenetetrahydrofolate reductase [NAD(P)H] [Ectothiorhodospira variabilis]MCG5526079.1 methylenetetrahydrofolate reductase [NAD(P)H] [Ectothiorhodospira haloalkaliphila]
MKTQKQHERTFSFEFFPPKNDEGAKKLKDTWTELAKLEPRFFSVTYGAGGSTQARTLETVLDIHKNSGVDAAPHLSCIDSTAEQMRGILQLYKDNGLRHIVALRGDLPSGMRDPGEFRYANELVEFIRKETGDHFTLEVAAYPEFHPQAPNALKDLQNFKRKVDAGADSAITQYFYSAEAYFRFVEDCEKLDINIPIVPGIMPITNYKQLARFSDACGAEIPRWIRKRLEAFGEDTASIKAFGEEVVTEMCDQLLKAGAPGLHFYTMNQAGPIKAIWKNLGLKPEPR